MFTVKIPMTGTVAALKYEIKTSNSAFLRDINAKDLELWRVNFPADDLSSVNCPTYPELKDPTPMSELFKPGLDPKIVHIVVRVPADPESQHIAVGKQEGMRDTFAALDRSGCFLLFF